MKLANRVVCILNPSAYASDSASHCPSCTEELWGRDWYSLGQVTHAYLIWRKNHAGENALGWASQFYYVNAIRTSHWNETPSVINIIPVLYKNPPRYLCLWLHSYLQSCNCPVIRVQKQLSQWRQLWRTIPSVTAMHEGSGTFIDKPGNCYGSLRHKYEIQPQWIYLHEAVLVKCRLQFTRGEGWGGYITVDCLYLRGTPLGSEQCVRLIKSQLKGVKKARDII